MSTTQQLIDSRLLAPYYVSADDRFVLYHGDAVEVLSVLAGSLRANLLFADPPYFLSNGGVTCQAGRMVCVNKGSWDKLASVDQMHEFNIRWLRASRDLLDANATMWVSGTRHVIFSVGFAMQQLGMKLLNEIIWEKPNPPPNLSCRYFTHATETLLWAAKAPSSRHTFDYQRMRQEAGGTQMKSIWRLCAAGRNEKRLGRHPTQKPLALLDRIVLASSIEGDLVVDPFLGSGTTGIAAARHDRRFIGIDFERRCLDLAILRYEAERK